ncbi:unnamed protein product, partial [Nesidiocoris tenuis]
MLMELCRLSYNIPHNNIPPIPYTFGCKCAHRTRRRRRFVALEFLAGFESPEFALPVDGVAPYVSFSFTVHVCVSIAYSFSTRPPLCEQSPVRRSHTTAQ